MKEEEVINLSNKFNFNPVEVFPLKLEASGREYWRIINESKETAVLCYLDPKIDDHSNFINISNELKKNNIRGVEIFYHNKEDGVTIQEDLGDEDLISIFNDNNKKELLEMSLELLVDIQESEIANLEEFSKKDLINQMSLFNEIFCQKFLDIKSDDSINDLIEITIDKLYEHPWVNCHFDFERRNLVLKDNNQLIVIDYQDMKRGPIGIDLAGILADHYFEADISNIKRFINFYSTKINSKYSDDECFEFTRWGCIQRNLRILGTLSNLFLVKNRSFRLKDMPLILKNLTTMIPNEHPSKIFLEKNIEPLLLETIEQL